MKNAHQRQLALLKQLYHNDNWQKLEDLAHHVNASVYSIREDLLFIQETFPHLIQITERHQHVQATFTAEVDLASFYRYYARHSLTNRLIEELLFHPYADIDDMAEVLETSRSSLYRLLPNINQQLQSEAGLQIKTNPLHIVGDEWDIRQFYQQFYQELTTPFSWPLDDKDFEVLQKVFRAICKILDLDLYIADENRLLIAIGVSLIRLRHRSYLSAEYFTQPIRIAVTRVSVFLDASHYLQLLSQCIGMPVDQGLLFDLFYPLFKYVEPIHKVSKKTLAPIIEELNFIQQQLDIHLPDTARLAGDFYLAMHRIADQSMPKDDSLQRYESFVERIRHDQTLVYQQMHDGIVSCLEACHIEFNTSQFSELFFWLITHWPNLISQLNPEKSRLRILVVSDLSESHAQFIADDLTHHFPAELLITTHIRPDQFNNAYFTAHFDLIITTCFLGEITELPTINISLIPQAKHYVQIQQHITNT